MSGFQSNAGDVYPVDNGSGRYPPLEPRSESGGQGASCSMWVPTHAPWAKGAGPAPPLFHGGAAGPAGDDGPHAASTLHPQTFIRPPATGMPMPPTARPPPAAWAPAGDAPLAASVFDPVGSGPPLPPLTSPPPGGWAPPQRRISSPAELAAFQKSATGGALVAFLAGLAAAVRSKKLSSPCPPSPGCDSIVALLATLESWVDDIPPVSQPMRYGNTAFRAWHARLVERGPSLLAALLPPQWAGAEAEVGPYLGESFGNAVRIDYGTGHEATFAALLLALCRLGVVDAGLESQALVARVFAAYLRLMRRLQTTYWLEPAGSHGVWGLDDYCFLPFYFGASQMVDHPVLKPRAIHSDDSLAAGAKEYLYLEAVRFVKQVKKGPLAETSPILSDIAGVASWDKIAGGMLKMYQAEVLGKVPIMQHFLFGHILPWLPPADA